MKWNEMKRNEKKWNEKKWNEKLLSMSVCPENASEKHNEISPQACFND